MKAYFYLHRLPATADHWNEDSAWDSALSAQPSDPLPDAPRLMIMARPSGGFIYAYLVGRPVVEKTPKGIRPAGLGLTLVTDAYLRPVADLHALFDLLFRHRVVGRVLQRDGASLVYAAPRFAAMEKACQAVNDAFWQQFDFLFSTASFATVHTAAPTGHVVELHPLDADEDTVLKAVHAGHSVVISAAFKPRIAEAPGQMPTKVIDELERGYRKLQEERQQLAEENEKLQHMLELTRQDLSETEAERAKAWDLLVEAENQLHAAQSAKLESEVGKTGGDSVKPDGDSTQRTSPETSSNAAKEKSADSTDISAAKKEILELQAKLADLEVKCIEDQHEKTSLQENIHKAAVEARKVTRRKLFWWMLIIGAALLVIGFGAGFALSNLRSHNSETDTAGEPCEDYISINVDSATYATETAPVAAPVAEDSTAKTSQAELAYGLRINIIGRSSTSVGQPVKLNILPEGRRYLDKDTRAHLDGRWYVTSNNATLVEGSSPGTATLTPDAAGTVTVVYQLSNGTIIGRNITVK